MAKVIMTPERYEEIQRLLELQVSIHEIKRKMKCTRRTVRDIRDGILLHPSQKKPIPGAVWASQVDWQEVLDEIIEGHPIKFVWSEVAEDKVGYKAFWKEFHKQFPQYKQATVVHRVFEPGDRCEVDYAGQKVEWVDIKTGQIHEVPVFVGALGFSQLFFAIAKPNAQSPNFLDCHNKMYRYFGGVPKITVPDCLKTGVKKCHLYDPDLNPSYADMAQHYGTAIVPARPRRPKDKAIVEGAVKIIMRYFRWKYRKHTFTSIAEINEALLAVVDTINKKPHSRFTVSRFDRWEKTEKAALKPLPTESYEYAEWKKATLHADSYVHVENNYYSAPHIYRGLSLKVKLSSRYIEIFRDLERVAIHNRYYGNNARRITQDDHLPPNARAYHEATPQNLLSQSKFLSVELYNFIDELFIDNTLGNLRRAQGLIREARKEINLIGHEKGRGNIKQSLQAMRLFNKIKVPYFKEQLKKHRLESSVIQPTAIKRKSGNPMLRHLGAPDLKLVTPKENGDKNVCTSQKPNVGNETGRNAPQL